MESLLHYELGRSYFEAKDYRSAIRELTEVLEQSPGNVDVRLTLAQAYFHSALLAPAEQQLREIIEMDPTEAYAHLVLARTLERQSRSDEAQKHRRLAAVMTGDESLVERHRVMSA